MADECITVTMKLVDRTTRTLNNINKELSHTHYAFESAARASKVAAQSQATHLKEVKATTFSIRDLIASVGALTIAYKGLALAQSAIQTSDTMVTSRARLSIISDTPNSLLSQVYQMSQEARVEFMEMANTVAKMGVNVGVGEGQWFKNTDQLVRFNELLAKTFKTGGQNNKEIAAGMLQLTQAMSSGRLQGDEFRSMFENAPLYISYIGKYMAEVDKRFDEFGKVIPYTAGELKEMAMESKITTDIMINAMMTGADEIEKNFHKLPVTIEDRWTQMVNMIRQQARSLFKNINDLVNTDAFVMFLDQLSNQLTFIVSGLTTIVKILSPAINFALATWKIWSPIAVLLAGALGYVITKMFLLEMGVTKAAIAERVATAESQMLALATNASGEAASFCRIQYETLNEMLGRNVGISNQVIVKSRAIQQADRLTTSLLKSETIALVANTTAKMLNNLADRHAIISKGVQRLLSIRHSQALTGETLATNLLTMATTALNFAMAYLTIPLTIGIGVLWVAIKVINKLTGSSYSLAGVLMGVVNTAVTAITNGLIDMYNAAAAVYNLFGIFGAHADYIDRHSYTDAWHEGLDYGNISTMSYDPALEELAGIKGNTDKIVDNTGISSEDLKFIRAVAEDRVYSRVSSINVQVVNNNDMKVNNDYDLDGIVDYITTGIEDAYSIGASGVHE